MQSTLIFLCYFMSLKKCWWKKNCWWWLTKWIFRLLIDHSLHFGTLTLTFLMTRVVKTIWECKEVTTQRGWEWAWILMILSQSWIPLLLFLLIGLGMDMWHNFSQRDKKGHLQWSCWEWLSLLQRRGHEEGAFLLLTLGTVVQVCCVDLGQDCTNMGMSFAGPKPGHYWVWWRGAAWVPDDILEPLN